MSGGEENRKRRISQMNNAELIERVRQLDSSATKGPWHRGWIYGALRHISKHVDSEIFLSDEELKAAPAGGYQYPDPLINSMDTDFITESRQLLPALATALESALAEIERLKGLIGERLSCEHCGGWFRVGELTQATVNPESATLCWQCATGLTRDDYEAKEKTC